MISYDYYLNTYYGATSAFSDAETWNKYQSRAWDKLKHLTFGRVSEDSTDDDVKKAVCALADAIYQLDGVKAEIAKRGGSVVASMSSLGMSVSFGNSDTELARAGASAKDEQRYLFGVAETYLAGSGLLYGGF